MNMDFVGNSLIVTFVTSTVPFFSCVCSGFEISPVCGFQSSGRSLPLSSTCVLIGILPRWASK